ncbi:MAG TPA: DUF2513 domain-containing protein [Pirellulales bacterium]
MELIRKIVLAVEENPTGFCPPLKIDGYDADVVGYHAYLLVDGKLATGISTAGLGSKGPKWMVSSLTWAGHEFADAIRDDSVWKQAQETVKVKGGGFTFEVLKDLLASILKTAVLGG